MIGADLSTKALLILGAANLFADGFSMAAANFTGTKAEIEEYESGWRSGLPADLGVDFDDWAAILFHRVAAQPLVAGAMVARGS